MHPVHPDIKALFKLQMRAVRAENTEELRDVKWELRRMIKEVKSFYNKSKMEDQPSWAMSNPTTQEFKVSDFPSITLCLSTACPPQSGIKAKDSVIFLLCQWFSLTDSHVFWLHRCFQHQPDDTPEGQVGQNRSEPPSDSLWVPHKPTTTQGNSSSTGPVPIEIFKLHHIWVIYHQSYFMNQSSSVWNRQHRVWKQYITNQVHVNPCYHCANSSTFSNFLFHYPNFPNNMESQPDVKTFWETFNTLTAMPSWGDKLWKVCLGNIFINGCH